MNIAIIPKLIKNHISINQNDLYNANQIRLSRPVYDPYLEDIRFSTAHENRNIKRSQVCIKLHSKGSQRGSSSVTKVSIKNIKNRFRT
jgi:hypothetical protein